MRINVVFHGRVQGVGFRMAAKSVAQGHGLVGWVRNEPDGTVRLVAEGDEARVNAFLEGIKSRMDDFISSADVIREDDSGRYRAFEIRH